MTYVLAILAGLFLAAAVIAIGTLIPDSPDVHPQFPQAQVRHDRSCADDNCVQMLPGCVLRFSDRSGINVHAVVGRWCW